MNYEKIMKISGYIVLSFVLAVSFYIVLAGYSSGAFKSSDAFIVYVKQYGLFAPLIFVLFQIVQVILPVIPSFLGYIGGTAMFGISGGFLFNYIGIVLGSLLAFFLARKWGTGFVKSMVKEKSYTKCVQWLNKTKAFPITLFCAILLPLAPDDVLCYLSGLTRMSYKTFALIIVLGKPWCILAYCLAFGKFI